MVHIGNSWDEKLKDQFTQEYYLKLRSFLKREYAIRTIYPLMNNIFDAFKLVSFEDVKVVILGQDPYHEPHQAHGLAFSVEEGVELPRSLQNIYREIHDELGLTMPRSGNLSPWARQGVLLLNTVLTVRRGEANSHKNQGWEIFTDSVIRMLNEREKPVIFVLWGNNAKSKIPLITSPHHHILKAAHPSPLSASYGFFGCGHFITINKILTSRGERPIDWSNVD